MSEQNSDANRDHLVDNIKALLITAVVIGHFIEAYIRQVTYMKAIFLCIYSFHMPLFVFISGYLSKSEKSLSRYKLLISILIPYVVFSFLWYLRASLHTKDLYIDIFSPPFHLWYLLSLFGWRLLLPFFKAIKYPIAVSIAIALVVGFSPLINNVFSMSRTLSLFPFFLVGNACSSATLHRVHEKKYLASFGILGILLLAAYVLIYNPLNWNIVFWGVSYSEMGYLKTEGLLLRAGLLILAGLVSLSVIVLSSSKKQFFTSLGARTITIYVFHGFFVPSFSIRFNTWHQSILSDVIIVGVPIFVALPAFAACSRKILSSLHQRY